VVRGATLTETSLQAYKGQAAELTALTEVFLVTKSGMTEPFPADTELAASLKPLFEHVMSVDLDETVEVSSMEVLPLAETVVQAIPSKQVNVYWKASLSDGGALISRIMLHGLQFQESITHGIEGADFLAWAQHVQVDDYSILDYKFSFSSAVGNRLRQELGTPHKSEVSKDGTFPYIISR